MPARLTPRAPKGKSAVGLSHRRKKTLLHPLPQNGLARAASPSFPFFSFPGLPASSVSPRRLRGQGSVEYLFVVVFLVGFIVAVLVPSLQTAEVSYALAGARAQAVAYQANHSELRLLTINSSVLQAEGRVLLNATVYNRSADAVVPAPQGLKDAMLAGIHRLAPNMGVSSSCVNTSNYEYCFVP